jgi:PAS domain S-box-containing protein
MSPFRPAQTIRSHWYAFGFVLAYAVTAAIAYKWTVGAGGLAILWPCNGLVAAAFLLLRRRDAVIVALTGAVIDGLGVLWMTPGQGPRALLIAGCDLSEAFLAATLMRRFCGAAVDVTNIRRLLRLTVLSALPATMLVGTVGALLSHVLFGDPIGLLWLTWAVGDLLGMMVGAPSALIIARFPRYLRDDAAGAAESLAIVLGLGAVAVAQLFLNGQRDVFLIFPFLLLAMFRISAPYATLAIVAISAITTGFTIGGVGPFAASLAAAKVNLVSLQLFLACVTVSTLIAQGWLTSLFQARRRAAKALSAARQKAVQAQEVTNRRAESEARYRMLADNTTDIILRYDAEARIEYVSPSIRQLGYEIQEFLDLAPAAIVHPDDWPRIAARRDALFRGERGESLKTRVRHKDGRWISVESRPAPIRGDDGAVVGVVSALRDISEGMAAEQALIDSEARYRMLADNTTDIILCYNSDRRIEYVSPSIRQLGYQPQEFLSLTPGHAVHPDDWPNIADRIAAIFRGEPGDTLEARARNKDGRWIWLESRPAPIRGENGAVVGIVSVLRDISKRKAAEQALIDSEARYRILAENTNDIIQRLNIDYRVEYMSPSIRQLGYEPEFFLGRESMSIVHPDQQETLRRRREDVLLGRSVPPLEVGVFSASGELVWLESNISPIRDASGVVTGVVNVMRNITERKAAEAALRQVNSELQRVARVSALGAFATSLGHEINQPLAAIVANSEAALRWLSRGPPDTDEAIQAVERTRDNAWRASQVVARLRSMVTKDAPVKTEFDARDAIREVLDLTASRRTEASVPVTQALGRGPKRIVADRIQFQQVIMNLVLNAVEAMQDMPSDQRRLFVSCKNAVGGGIEIKVEDRGPGVDPELRETIFDNLFTTKTGGTGLGLPISRSIVEAHGGTLTVDNAEPRGAAFVVQLPPADPAKGA